MQNLAIFKIQFLYRWLTSLFTVHIDKDQDMSYKISPEHLLDAYLLTCLLTYLLTYSMEQSPSLEANWFYS